MATQKTKAAPPAPMPPNTRAPTTTELWYLDCFRILAKHYKRSPKITELAAYCGRSVYPTWAAMISLEAKGVLRREEQEDGRNRFVEV